MNTMIKIYSALIILAAIAFGFIIATLFYLYAIDVIFKDAAGLVTYANTTIVLNTTQILEFGNRTVIP